MFSLEDLQEVERTSIPYGVKNDYLRRLYDQDSTSCYYSFLYNVAEKLPAGAIIVELGAYAGRSTAHLAAGNPLAKVFTVDISPRSDFHDNVKPFGNIKLMSGRSDDKRILDEFPKGSVDLCFFDTEHTYEVVSSERKCWEEKLKYGSVLMFDDIFVNDGMSRFWEELELDKSSSKNLHWTGFGYAIK